MVICDKCGFEASYPGHEGHRHEGSSEQRCGGTLKAIKVESAFDSIGRDVFQWAAHQKDARNVNFDQLRAALNQPALTAEEAVLSRGDAVPRLEHQKALARIKRQRDLVELLEQRNAGLEQAIETLRGNTGAARIAELEKDRDEWRRRAEARVQGQFDGLRKANDELAINGEAAMVCTECGEPVTGGIGSVLPAEHKCRGFRTAQQQFEQRIVEIASVQVLKKRIAELEKSCDLRDDVAKTGYAATMQRANALADECGRLKDENTQLLAENARLRRR